MANPEHLKILKEGVQSWNEWRRAKKVAKPDLIGADLAGADLVGANLRSANLEEAILRKANLTSANLTRAELSGAKLSNAVLIETVLIGAKIIAANLTMANLFGANLCEANLRGSVLWTANLSSATLLNSSFDEAILWFTVFGATSLKSVFGLESCVHSGRSILDYHTLMRSGPLPEVFLRGCGLSDEFIRYLPSFWNQPIQFYSCFISYSHEDKSFARRLHDALQGRGIRCWLDEDQIKAGDKIHRAVDEGIRQRDKVLLCCSKASLTSWWVNQEVEKALMKEEKLSKERGREILAIIPLNLDGYLFKSDWQDWKQQHLISRNAPDFTGWDKDKAKFEAQLDHVMQALRADSGARQPPPKPLL
jgi:hypothetical protein